MIEWKPNREFPVCEEWFTKTIYILGGGPSLLDMDLSRLRSKMIIGVNQAYKLGSWVDICWFGDGKWFEHNVEGLISFSGLVATCARGFEKDPLVNYFEEGKTYGIETRVGYIAWNLHSGGSAINLAYHLGAKRMVLLGFDMKSRSGKYNWHSDYPVELQHPRESVYQKFLDAYGFIKDDAEKLGLEIVNATPDSALKEFPMVNLEEII